MEEEANTKIWGPLAVAAKLRRKMDMKMSTESPKAPNKQSNEDVAAQRKLQQAG